MVHGHGVLNETQNMGIVTSADGQPRLHYLALSDSEQKSPCIFWFER